MPKVTKTNDRWLSTGKRVKECRELRALSQEELIDRIHLLPGNNGKTRNPKQISYIENGTRKLSNDYAVLISQALDVRIEYLLLEDDFMTEADRISIHANNCSKSFELIVEIMKLHNFTILDVTNTGPIRTDDDGNEYQDVRLELRSPRGSIHPMSHQELQNLLESIDSFIDCQCAIKFKKLIDGVKNIYEWSV